MGRWAQRRLGSSSGSGAGPTLLIITSAEVTGPQDLGVVFSGDVDAADFTPADFTTAPSNFNATTVTQFDANVLAVSFGDNISAEVSLVYAGTTPGVLTPETITLS